MDQAHEQNEQQKQQTVSPADQQIPAPSVGEPQPQTPATPVTATGEADAKTWHMLCHLLALAGYVVPLGNIFGPIIIWQVKKNEIPSVVEHGKAAVNFQISMAIYAIIALILSLVFIGIILLPIIGIYTLIMIIVNSINASQGRPINYPLTIRFLQ